MARKKSVKKETPDDSIHVRLDTPMAIRREVLSLAVDAISLLKRYYEFLDAKKQKDDLMKLLRSDINEIKRLTKELDIEEMPLSVSQLIGLHTIEPKEKSALKAEMHVIAAEELRREDKRKRELEQVKVHIPPKSSKQPVKLLPKDKLETELAELKSLISRL